MFEIFFNKIVRRAISIVIFRKNYASHIDWNEFSQVKKKKIHNFRPHLKSNYNPHAYFADFFIYLLDIFFFFPSLFCLCCTAHRILVSKSGIKPVSPTVEAQSLNHWTIREVLTKPSVVKNKKQKTHYLQSTIKQNTIKWAVFVEKYYPKREFTGSRVVRTPCFHCSGYGPD